MSLGRRGALGGGGGGGRGEGVNIGVFCVSDAFADGIFFHSGFTSLPWERFADLVPNLYC